MNDPSARIASKPPEARPDPTQMMMSAIARQRNEALDMVVNLQVGMEMLSAQARQQAQRIADLEAELAALRIAPASA